MYIFYQKLEKSKGDFSRIHYGFPNVEYATEVQCHFPKDLI